MKFMSMYVCAALLLVALFFSPYQQNDIDIGRGNGTDEEIKTIDDVGDCMAFFAGIKSANSLYENSEENTSFPTKMSYQKGSSVQAAEAVMKSPDDENSEIDDASYSSGTIHEVAYMYQEGNNGHYSTLNRTLSIYMNEGTSYYHSKGTNEGRNKDGSYQVIFDIEVYVGEKQTLIKINRYQSNMNDGVPFSEDAFGKWLDVSKMGDIAEMDFLNREVFGELAFYISENKDTHFIKENDIYTLAEKYSEGEMLKIDLSNSKRPILEMSYIYDGEGKTNAFINMDAIYTFENINNTVVELDEDIEIERNIEKYLEE